MPCFRVFGLFRGSQVFGAKYQYAVAALQYRAAMTVPLFKVSKGAGQPAENSVTSVRIFTIGIAGVFSAEFRSVS
jgi:hypothetical protein